MSYLRGRQSGFTLLEMVVVLFILAAVAGLSIPIVSMLGRSSDMAASAKTQSDLANNIQLFFTLQRRYPTRRTPTRKATGCPTPVRTERDCKPNSRPPRSPATKLARSPVRVLTGSTTT
jgi:prepilin-type N-terminal cleavage/methylation domain-containing protein